LPPLLSSACALPTRGPAHLAGRREVRPAAVVRSSADGFGTARAGAPITGGRVHRIVFQAAVRRGDGRPDRTTPSWRHSRGRYRAPVDARIVSAPPRRGAHGRPRAEDAGRPSRRSTETGCE